MNYVYLHGLGQSASAWDPILPYLKEGLPALRPDLPELLQGREPVYTELYAAFGEYCDSLPEPIGLCGLSLGAVLALHYTIEHPQKVKALALIGAQYKMPRPLLRLQSFILKFMKGASFQQSGFDKKAFIRLSGSMESLDFSEELTRVSCHTLVLCGEKDKPNQKAARNLAARLPGAELHMVAGAGHEVNQEAPRELATLLERYYRESADRPS